MSEVNKHLNHETNLGSVNGVASDSQPRQAPNPTAAKSHPTSWATIGSTPAFRALNFELFMKPNKYVMACGVLAFTGCVSYIVYMNVTDDKKKDSYVTLDEDGGMTVRQRTSRWY